MNLKYLKICFPKKMRPLKTTAWVATFPLNAMIFYDLSPFFFFINQKISNKALGLQFPREGLTFSLRNKGFLGVCAVFTF